MNDRENKPPRKTDTGKPRFRIGRWAGLTISLLFLFLAFKGFDWKEFSQALSGVKLSALFLSVCIYLSTYFLRGVRWSMMLRNVKRISLWKMIKFVIIGFMCNNILPARLGEFARALIIGKGENISARASFASVVLERVFDGVTIVLLLVVLAIQQPFPEWVKKMGLFSAALFLLFFILLTVLGHKGEVWIEKWECSSRGIICKIAAFLSKFVHGLQMLRDRRMVLLVMLLSFIIWSIEVINYLVVMRGLGIALPLGAAAFALVVVNLGIMIPSSPGFVGTLQYFCVLALSVYAVPKDLALAYAIVLHAVMYIPITVLGLIFLARTGITLKTLSRSRSYAQSMENESP